MSGNRERVDRDIPVCPVCGDIPTSFSLHNFGGKVGWLFRKDYAFQHRAVLLGKHAEFCGLMKMFESNITQVLPITKVQCDDCGAFIQDKWFVESLGKLFISRFMNDDCYMYWRN